VKKRTVAGIVGVLAIAIGLFFAGRQFAPAVPGFVQWVHGLGWWGPAIFIVGYAVATVAMVPGTVLTLAAGAVFGIGWGFLWVLIGASLGAIGAFLVSRYLARGLVERRLLDPRFRAVDAAIGEQGFRIVALLRLSPVFPFNVLNYGLGLTRVRFRDYALACFAMAPGTLLYVYYGRVAGDLASVAAGSVERGPEYWSFLVLGLAATLLVTLFVTRLARRALRESASVPDLLKA
jgi:uncharacterized membrane protein YdjX (TVP38/TMEM64 family)